MDTRKPLCQNCYQTQYISIKYFGLLESCWNTPAFKS